jgi:outer membrane receptor for ferrienterochelin and colicins
MDSKQVPVNGIVVTVKSIDLDNSAVFISDNKGLIEVNLPFPVIIQTMHFAFKPVRDTLYNAGKSFTFNMVANNINLNEVTVTGNYSTTDRSVYQTQVISKNQIQAQGANNVQDLFTHQLNVRVANDAATGSSISLQGIGGENIKVLVDGVPVIGRLYNNINLSQLNLNNVERVEVIRGPASVLYGTNALGGVINIITNTSANTPLKAGFNTYYESNGQYNADIYTNLHFRKTDISINGGRNYFDGWSENEVSRADEWKPKEQRFGSIRFGQKIKNTKFVFQSALFDEQVINRSGDIRGLPYKAYAFDEYFNTIRFNNEIQCSHLFSAKRNLQVTAAYSYYRYHRATYKKDLVSLNEVLSADVAHQVGLDLNNEYTTGSRIEDNKKDNGDYAAFLSVEYRPVNKLLVRPAVRYAYNTTYKAPVVPSLQLLYELGVNTVIRASYSQGFRSPSLKEMYLQFVDANHNVFGNTNLIAEDSWHYLASVDQTFKLGNSRIKLSPSVFYNHINNKITLASSGDAYTYLNFYEFVTRGVQVTAAFSYGAFELSSGYSYTGIFNSEIENSSFLYASELNNIAQYKIAKTNTLLAVFWKFNGKLPEYLVDDAGVVTIFKGQNYSMVDASVNQKLMKDRITIGAGLKNILNVTTINNLESAGAHQSNDNRVFTGMGRSVFVRLQYQFSK